MRHLKTYENKAESDPLISQITGELSYAEKVRRNFKLKDYTLTEGDEERIRKSGWDIEDIIDCFSITTHLVKEYKMLMETKKYNI